MPSGINPLPCVARIATHRLDLRLRQYSHCRHSGVYSGMTWSPLRTLVTPAPGLDHDPGALMPEDRRENALRIGAGQGELIGVADAGRLDFDQDFAGARAFQVHGFQAQWLAGLAGHGSADLHGVPSCWGSATA